MVCSLQGGELSRGKLPAAFTLVEMLVSMAVFSMLMLIVFKSIDSVSNVWTSASNKTSAFQGARAAFEAMTRNLSQATLQTYFAYADANGNPVPLVNPSASKTIDRTSVPKYYLRSSELHFVAGQANALLTTANVNPPLTAAGAAIFFQAPIGVTEKQTYRPNDSMLSTLGYYIEFNPSIPPANITRAPGEELPTYRYRLMEVIQPAEKNNIYASTIELDSNNLPLFNYDLNWITKVGLSASAGAPKHVLAENVVALAFRPKLTRTEDPTGALIAPDYAYDSRSWEQNYSGKSLKPDSTKPDDPTVVGNSVRNQLPPIVEVVMVAIHENSAIRLVQQFGKNQPFLSSRYPLGQPFSSDATKLDDELKDIESKLQQWDIRYQVFRTEVPIQAARWSN